MINIFSNRLVRKVFQKMRLFIILVFVVIIFFYALRGAYYVAFCTTLVGEILQIWAAASLRKNKILSLKGPYVLIRNPMYVGRFFVFLGLVILMEHIIPVIVYCILYSFYVTTRVRREEKKLKAIYGNRYEEYTHRINRFIPHFRNFSFSDLAYFNVSNLLANRELYNLLGIIIFFIIVHIKIY